MNNMLVVSYLTVGSIFKPDEIEFQSMTLT